MTSVTRQATSDLSNTGGYTTSPLFSKINDSSDSTQIVGVTQGGGRATFGFTAFALISTDIVSSVDIHYRHRSTTTGNAYAHGACIKVGSTYYGRGEAGGTTYWDAGQASGVGSGSAIADRIYVGTLNPATGAAWLYNAVNALTEFGVCSDDFNPDANFYQVDITVNYTTQANITITLTATMDANSATSAPITVIKAVVPSAMTATSAMSAPITVITAVLASVMAATSAMIAPITAIKAVLESAMTATSVFLTPVLDIVNGGGVYYGILKRWTGAAWTKGKLMVYVGGSWQAKPIKRWDGANWKEVDGTGI